MDRDKALDKSALSRRRFPVGAGVHCASVRCKHTARMAEALVAELLRFNKHARHLRRLHRDTIQSIEDVGQSGNLSEGELMATGVLAGVVKVCFVCCPARVYCHHNLISYFPPCFL